MAVLLDNFITAATRIEFEERLKDSEQRHREQVMHARGHRDREKGGGGGERERERPTHVYCTFTT